MRDYTSMLWEIWIHCYERFSIWFTHQPSIFTVGMNWRRIILISRRFYFQPSLLVIHIPVHLYSPRLRRRFRRSILTAVMLGLRSANEWKHGATRSAITTEQIPTAVMRPPIIYYPEMAHITIIESYYALLMLSLFSFSNFFMISPISFISNKIETHFVLSYISHQSYL